jgi:hypothetical protein
MSSNDLTVLGDNLPWSEAEALTFQRQFTAPAKTGADLLRVVMGVLADIAQNLTWRCDFAPAAGTRER